MSKREFLDKLTDALRGEVPESVIRDNVNYYDNYIDNEINNGKTEEEVLALIGEPRLIAKTIIDVSGNQDTVNTDNRYESTNNSSAEDDSNDNYNIHPTGIFGTKGCIIGIIIMAVIFMILSFVLKLALRFAVPILIIILIVLIIKEFKK